MKLKLILFLYIIAINSTVAQDPPRGGYFEIYTHVEDQTPPDPYQNYTSVKLWMTSVGIVWDQDHTSSTFDIQPIITSVNYASACKKNYPEIVDVPIGNNSFNYGIYHVLTNWYIEDRTFGYGLYDFYIGYEFDDPLITFRLDYRDCHYTTYYGANDIWVIFNPSNSSVEIDWDNGLGPQTITAGNTYKIWEEKNKTQYNNIQNTDYFELFLTITNQNGHPYLQWNQYHTSVSGYYVHKILTTESGTITTQHFTTSTSWTDTDFTIGNPKFTNDEVEYWITAKLSPTTQSLEGNHVVKYGTSWIQWKISNKNDTKGFTYELNQNYPNPFNPSTEINYSIADDGFVKIEVFNILGKIVRNLVNEHKVKGNYNINFKSKNLPSGLYIYRMQANNRTLSKKMVLLR